MAGRPQLINKQKTFAIFFSSWLVWLAIFVAAYSLSFKKHVHLPYFDDEKVPHSGFAMGALAAFSILWSLTYLLFKPSETRECCTFEKMAGFQTCLASFLFTSVGAAYMYVEHPKLVDEIPDLPRFAFGLAVAALVPAMISSLSWVVCCAPRVPVRPGGLERQARLRQLGARVEEQQIEGELDQEDLADDTPGASV